MSASKTDNNENDNIDSFKPVHNSTRKYIQNYLQISVLKPLAYYQSVTFLMVNGGIFIDGSSCWSFKCNTKYSSWIQKKPVD